MNIIKVDQFDVTKFAIPQFVENSAYMLHMSFPTYKYSENNIDKCVILTEPIKMVTGGILQKNTNYRQTDNACLRIIMHTNTHAGAEHFKINVCEPIDDFVRSKIKENKIQIKKSDDKIIPLQNLNYKPLVKKCYNDGLQYKNNEGEYLYDKNNHGKYIIEKVSIKINTIESNLIDPTTKQPYFNILTRVFIPENTSVPINERKFKTTPEVINCLDDLRQHLTWNSTVRFVIRVQKFWSLKQREHRSCGISLVCEQIYVIDNPSWKIALKFDVNKIPLGLGLMVAADMYTLSDKYDSNDNEDYNEDNINYSIKKV